MTCKSKPCEGRVAVHGNEKKCTVRDKRGWQIQTASYSSALRMYHTSRVPSKFIMFCNCMERRRKVVIERSKGCQRRKKNSLRKKRQIQKEAGSDRTCPNSKRDSAKSFKIFRYTYFEKMNIVCWWTSILIICWICFKCVSNRELNKDT